MPEKQVIEKMRRQAELLKSDKILNLDMIVTITSLFRNAVSRLNKWKFGSKKRDYR